MKAISSIPAISQGHLNIWERCQRKYQYTYLEELGLPEADPVTQQKLLLGANFHLLMQQKQLGLDVSDLASSDTKLRSWLMTFDKQPPEMISGDRLCEHRRTLEISLHHRQNNHDGQEYFVLNAIYDFLILGDRQAQILDWKTHQRAIAKEKLEHNWQTRLYLYLLAKTSNYEPEQLSMTYWFANTGEAIVINYSQAKLDRTTQDLERILTELSQALEAWQLNGVDYPQRPLEGGLSDGICNTCEFCDRCDRGNILTNPVSPKSQISTLNIADIPEIAI